MILIMCLENKYRTCQSWNQNIEDPYYYYWIFYQKFIKYQHIVTNATHDLFVCLVLFERLVFICTSVNVQMNDRNVVN